MKNIKIYVSFLALISLVSACELTDNIDPKSAREVAPSSLLTSAEETFVYTLDELSMNINISRFLVQYAAQTAYTQESRYNFADRQIPDSYWNGMYRSCMIDLEDAKAQLLATDLDDAANAKRDNKVAIIDIIEVYIVHTLVDYFGNVPYSEALVGMENMTPVYDDAATIYDDLMQRLTDVIATFNANAGAGSWGAEDILLGGDIAMWKKVAASLKLRLAMRLADTDATAAKANAEAAINAGLLEDGEALTLEWMGQDPYVNTYYRRFEIDGRTDYAPSKTIIDKMFALNDPRMSSYFTQVDTSGDGDYVYWGLQYGLTSNVNVKSYSTFAPVMFEPDYPSVLIAYDEVQFLLAEAAQRGFTTPQTAQEHYEEAIRASVEWWTGSDAGVAAYLADGDVAWDAARWKELIGTQKWIALYNRGNEGYASWRIFDWPVLSPPPDMTQADIPLRWPYPFNELDLNPESYSAAATAIGGDDVRTQLFWDVTPNSASPSAN
ncbi:MAG: SusD/RagB family nutrient-binding outer membrane lipoprotein [Bacteroidales bacterium]|nr:SusD/RagB family nutrient-binding outer membrane lipoprotein [Bacteroidales bacterium]